MVSKYAKKVRRLLRSIYPTPQPILKEVSVGKFSHDIKLSKKLKDLITLYDARLGRMKVDYWVKHQVAVEVHGEQHEKEVRFSNDIEDLAAELERRKGMSLHYVFIVWGRCLTTVSVLDLPGVWQSGLWG